MMHRGSDLNSLPGTTRGDLERMETLRRAVRIPLPVSILLRSGYTMREIEAANERGAPAPRKRVDRDLESHDSKRPDAIKKTMALPPQSESHDSPAPFQQPAAAVAELARRATETAQARADGETANKRRLMAEVEDLPQGVYGGDFRIEATKILRKEQR